MTDGNAEANVLIRNFRQSDSDDLLALLPLCFAEEFEVSGFDPDRVKYMVNRGFGTTGRLFRGLLRVFGKDPIKFLVAEIDGKMVGTAIVNDGGKVGYVSSVMVHPDYRRRGVAMRLVKSALDYTRQRKKARAVLHVDSTNMSAIGLYTELGFKVFEHFAYFLGDAGSTRLPEDTGGVEVRPFRKEDLEQVYSLIRSTEDPIRLRVYDFGKSDLRTSFLQHLFRFSTRKKIVAVLGGRIVGYVEATYSTAKVAGAISSIYVDPAEGTRSGNVERTLLIAACNEIAKGGTGKIRVTIPMENLGLTKTLTGLFFREALVMDGMVTEFQC
jgi:ribosomal-protein-alanine N-acetyltransferase